MADFRLSVYQSGDSNSPDDVFRRSWDWVREAGLAATATPNAYATGEEPAPGPADRTTAVSRAIEASRQSYPDFDAIARDETVPITNDIVDAALELGTDAAAGVFYYLGNNPDAARHISEMHPDQARRELAEIAQVVTGRHPNSRIKDVPDAPEPIRPTGDTVSISKDPEKMSQSEYEAWRKRGGQ
jgi:hypothetical protein